MIQTPTNDQIKELLSTSGICLSVYMPTHRSHPENLQDPILFRNLLKELQESLALKHASKDVTKIMEPLTRLSENKELWNHTQDGLAIFSEGDILQIFGLPVSVPQLVIAAETFHTKPIQKYLQSVERFQVLGLSLHEFKMFEGNRHSMVRLDIDQNIATNIKEVLGDELTDEHTTVASYGGVGGNKGNMVHGHGSRKDELDKDAERYFREVAKIVQEKFSVPSGLPLILAALPEHHALFHDVNNNSLLLKDSIAVNPLSVSTEKLAELAWQVMEPQYHNLLEKYSDDYNTSKANATGSDQLDEIAASAASGRIDTILIEENKVIPGKLDSQTGAIDRMDLNHPEVDDVLDDLGEMVIRMGGRIVIIPQEKMPTDNGVAAIYRY
jgi:hypothetical protein